MPSLQPRPVLKGRDVARLLEQHGFRRKRQKGSHAFFEHPSGKRCTVPIHGRKDLPSGTLLAILDDAGLDRECLAKRCSH